MADLMTGAYKYKDLQKKYKNFTVPAVKIKVNGTDLVDKQQIAVTSLKLQMSIDAASSCVFKIGGLYDLKNHSMKKDVKSKFKLGTIVEVELGYQSFTLNIFKGYVARIGMEFTQEANLVVTLMDARRLMMISGSKQILHDVKSYSDAVKNILNNYNKLCSVMLDDTKDELTKPIAQNSNDYEFITKQLLERAKVNREFFILADKVYFREPKSSKKSIMTMQYGNELLSLNVQSEYKDLSIEVVGYDYDKQEQISVTQNVKAPDGQQNIISQTPVCLIVDADADTQEKAKARASAIAKKEECKGNTAHAVTIGLPELVPGRFVEVKDLEEFVDRKYYITDVTHEIENNTFITTLTMTF